MKILLSKLNEIDIGGWGEGGETFVNKAIDGTLLHIGNYTFERKDRDTCNQIETHIGGGVLTYINDKINYSRIFDLETLDVESIWIEIN